MDEKYDNFRDVNIIDEIPEVDPFCQNEPKNALQRFSKKHAILCAACFTFINALIMLGSQFISSAIISAICAKRGISEISSFETYLFLTIAELVPLTTGMVGMYIFGYTKIFKEHKKGFWAGLIPAMYMIVLSLYSAAAQSFQQLANGNKEIGDLTLLLMAFVLCVFVGFSEEFIFRGVIAEMIYRKYANSALGVWYATIVSTALFALMHLVNLGTDVSASGVIIQVIMVFAQGLIFNAAYYRSRNIWSLVFIHGFLDFCSFVPIILLSDNGSLFSAISSYQPMMLIGILPCVGATCIVLRNSKIREMLGRTDIKADTATKKRFKIAVIIAGVILIGCFIWGIFSYALYIVENLKNIFL